MATSKHTRSPNSSSRRESAGSSRGSLVLGLAVLAAMVARGRPGHPVGSRPAHAEQTMALARPVADRREAQSPSEVLAAGWKEVIWRVYDAVQRDRIMLIAAGVTYYGLLALFPAIAALVSLYGLFANPEAITAQLTNLQGMLPQGALTIIEDQINRIQAHGGSTLGFYFFLSLAISLWSANAGVKSIFDALNAVYQEHERRSFLRYNLQSLMFTLGGLLFVILAVGSIVVLPAVLALVGLESLAGRLVSLLRWPMLLLITLIALALLYRYGPSRERAEWRWVTWGSGIATVVWLVGSMLFSWYVSNFGNFNQTYGSLGAVIGFMIWIWLSAITVLLGAEINAQLEHHTRKDTTTGDPSPIGERGAHFADRVAGD